MRRWFLRVMLAIASCIILTVSPFAVDAQIGPSIAVKIVTKASDPDTTGWGASQKGRCWFNTTSNLFKYWDGSAIVTGISSSDTGPLTITQNSDTLIFSGDGSDWDIGWSDGVLKLQTDEGTNTDSQVNIIGKGTGDSILDLYSNGTTDLSTIKMENEAGLGGRLTFGLDETARIMVICDYGDIDTDLGLSARTNPALYIFNADASQSMKIDYAGHTSSGAYASVATKFSATMSSDTASGNANTFVSSASVELTDDNAEQAWVYIEPKLNGANSSPFNSLQIKTTETLLGTGGHNFIKAGISTNDDVFVVDNSGKIEIDGHTTYHSAVTTLSTSQINNLRATPITLVAAQGANTWIEFVCAVLTYDYATAVFAVGADEDFVIEYADGTDTTASIESAGFIDQADDEIRWYPTSLSAGADPEATINQALRIFNTGAGETADGGGELDIRVTYRVHVTGF